MFQANQGPAHEFLFAGTSAMDSIDDGAATFVAENPQGLGGPGGCLAASTAIYNVISPGTAPAESTIVNSPQGTFCFSH